MRRISALITAIILVFTTTVFAENESVNQIIDNTEKYLLSAIPDSTVSSVGGEWSIIGISRNGTAVSDTYYINVLNYLNEHGGKLSDRKYTEYSRVILALTAIGKNPENVGGYNLLMPLGDYEKTIKQGINGAIWALIALDSNGYDVPYDENANVHATREMYFKKILDGQLPDGGWAMSGDEGDVDLTAMALQALRNYRAIPVVSEAIDKGVSFLSEKQNANGGYGADGEETAESTAQVLVALCGLGISPSDGGFVKNGKTLTDNIMSFYNGDGFSHIKGEETNLMATEQCFYALVALKRLENGESFLYDMTKPEEKNQLDGIYRKALAEAIGAVILKLMTVI